ncbi:hypothetical protein D3C71_1962780 [compost metagenome]
MYYRACGNNGPVPNRNARQNGRVRSDQYIFTDNDLTQTILLDEILMRQNRRIVANN